MTLCWVKPIRVELDHIRAAVATTADKDFTSWGTWSGDILHLAPQVECAWGVDDFEVVTVDHIDRLSSFIGEGGVSGTRNDGLGPDFEKLPADRLSAITLHIRFDGPAMRRLIERYDRRHVCYELLSIDQLFDEIIVKSTTVSRTGHDLNDTEFVHPLFFMTHHFEDDAEEAEVSPVSVEIIILDVGIQTDVFGPMKTVWTELWDVRRICEDLATKINGTLENEVVRTFWEYEFHREHNDDAAAKRQRSPASPTMVQPGPRSMTLANKEMSPKEVRILMGMSIAVIALTLTVMPEAAIPIFALLFGIMVAIDLGLKRLGSFPLPEPYVSAPFRSVAEPGSRGSETPD